MGFSIPRRSTDTRRVCVHHQVRQKQQNDPQYSFLFGGPDHPFYRWAMWCSLHNLNPDVPPMQQQQQLGDPVRRRHAKTLVEKLPLKGKEYSMWAVEGTSQRLNESLRRKHTYATNQPDSSSHGIRVLHTHTHTRGASGNSCCVADSDLIRVHVPVGAMAGHAAPTASSASAASAASAAASASASRHADDAAAADAPTIQQRRYGGGAGPSSPPGSSSGLQGASGGAPGRASGAGGCGAAQRGGQRAGGVGGRIPPGTSFSSRQSAVATVTSTKVLKKPLCDAALRPDLELPADFSLRHDGPFVVDTNNAC